MAGASVIVDEVYFAAGEVLWAFSGRRNSGAPENGVGSRGKENIPCVNANAKPVSQL
jgi:hypothetical protein